MILSVSELIDIVIMTAVVSYIFMDSFGRYKPSDEYDPLLGRRRSSFDWDGFKFTALVTAPAIVLHELGHKFFALSFGMQATFQAAYLFLGLGLLMKLMNFGFIFLVPAYVSIAGQGTPLEFGLIAAAGPLVNLILWLSTALITKQKWLNRKYTPALVLTSKINMFLFIFNMLPIPGFDGYKFFTEMIHVLL